MPPCIFVVIGPEKELDEFKEAVEACARKLGPSKVLSADKSVDGVARIQQAAQAGPITAVFASHHFCAAGKEEFSDLIRKILRDKFPSVPIVCWGNPGKGGELYKTHHVGLEWGKHGGDTNALLNMMRQLKNGEIEVIWKEKGGKGKPAAATAAAPQTSGRKSIDGGSGARRSIDGRPPSIDSPKPVARPSMDSPRPQRPGQGPPSGRPSMDTSAAGVRRNSIDREAPGTPSRNSMGSASGGGADEYSQWAAASGGSYTNMGMGMGSGMGGYGSMTGMQPMGMGAMGMGGMTGMGGMANGTSGMAGGMGGMGGMPGGMGGMGNGMGGMPGGMSGMAGGMGGMQGGGMGGMPLGGMGGMAGMGGMGAYGGGLGGMAAGLNGGMAPSGMGMGMGMASPSAMPAASPLMQMALSTAAATAAPSTGEVTNLLAGMSTSASSNGELIKMLAEEVVRLRKMLEDKRASGAPV